MSNDLLVNQIDALLPQTQCTLCGYNGCRPYATAVAQRESIDRCLPGGTPTLIALAQLVKQDPTPYLASMTQKTKSPTVAVIRENECIGCTKCIQACPVDAIIGASKFMHTVISDACTGCELCVAPCPVDCISLLPVNEPSPAEKKANATRWRKRYEQHQARLHRDKVAQANPQPLATITERKQSILDAVARVKAKKGQ